MRRRIVACAKEKRIKVATANCFYHEPTAIEPTPLTNPLTKSGLCTVAQITVPVEAANITLSIHLDKISALRPSDKKFGTISSRRVYMARGATKRANSRRRRLFSMSTEKPARQQPTPAHIPESQNWRETPGNKTGKSRVRVMHTLLIRQCLLHGYDEE